DPGQEPVDSSDRLGLVEDRRMADAWDCDQLRLGKYFEHSSRVLGGEQGAVFSTNDQHWLVGQAVEQRPWVEVAAAVFCERQGDGHVIIWLDAAVGPLAAQAAREAHPP